jgi:Prokaryotic Cytochrome C oxidase subunit IV
MNKLFFNRVSLIWLLLVAATALSWEIGHGFGIKEARIAGAVIIVIAFIKVRFVILDFMEIRTAPFFMRATAECWLVTICTVLIVLQLRTVY